MAVCFGNVPKVLVFDMDGVLCDFAAFIAEATDLIGSEGGTLLTNPTDPEVLENFYMKTRLFGVWGTPSGCCLKRNRSK